jgi:hypothetical protein
MKVAFHTPNLYKPNLPRTPRGPHPVRPSRPDPTSGASGHNSLQRVEKLLQGS